MPGTCQEGAPGSKKTHDGERPRLIKNWFSHGESGRVDRSVLHIVQQIDPITDVGGIRK